MKTVTSRQLQAVNLVKSYSRRKVVNEVSISISPGEIVGLLGPNGAGKTTTFYLIVGLIKPESGEIRLDEEDITRQPMYQRAALGIGYLPQETSIFQKLNVRDNINIILERQPMPAEQRKSRLDELLAELELTSLADKMAYTLSGGERRRVEITRALVNSPAFLLLDEPFAGIDPIAVADIQNIVRQLSAKGIGILITDHNVRETLSITDRAYLLNQGRIHLHGTPAEIVEDSKAREIYLGESFSL